jgi:Protein of unknown function (DUF1573)
MKNFLVIMVAAIAFAGCQGTDSKGKLTDEQKRNALKDSSNYTTIQWLDSTYKDIGKVKEGPTVPISFRFKNTGNHILIISDVTTSCGCTIAEKPEKPIAPGEEDVIKAVFTSKGHSGQNRKEVHVLANTLPQSLMTLTFSVEVTN